MQFKSFIIIIFLALLVVASYVVLHTPKASEEVMVDVPKTSTSIGLPVRFKIPSIKVDAQVEYVGIKSNGELDAPVGPVNVAWYKNGPRPGETGSAVIDGHYGWKDNIPAVFDRLESIQKGDKLYVENDKGDTVTFVVREIKAYGPNDKADEVFISNDGKAHLNLITCGGTWNAALKSYSKRVVVLSDME